MDSPVCPICYEDLNNNVNNESYKTSCNHTFHISCIRDWYNQNYYNTCPCCRQEDGNKHCIIPNSVPLNEIVVIARNYDLFAYRMGLGSLAFAT